MSQDISNIRRALSRVPTDIKQGNFISAVKSMRAASGALYRAPMMRAEQEEFVRLLGDGAALLRSNKEITRIFPLAITYVPGQEKALSEALDQLLSVLEENATEGMRDAMLKMEERKRAMLEKGREELTAGTHDEARATFNLLLREFDSDSDLAVEAGEAFIQAGLYSDALQFLNRAAAITPDSANLFNRLGILLRRMKVFPEAEQSFHKALELEPKEPNLHFNLGRLYVDMEKWANALKCAEAAQSLDPAFAEAAKLAAYCKRQLGQ